MTQARREEPSLRSALAALAEGAARLSAAVLLAAGGSGAFAPMAVGLVAAAPPGLVSLITLMGAVLGYFLTGDAERALRYAGACLLTAAAVFTLRDLPLAERRFFRPLAAAVMSACTGFVYIFEAGLSLGAFAVFFLEAGVSAVAAWAFFEAMQPSDAWHFTADGTRKRASSLISVALLLSAAAGFRLFGAASAGRAIAALLVLAAAFSGGAAAGAVCGAVFGAAVDTACGTVFFTVAFTFGGLLAALFRKHGRLAAALACASAVTLCGLWLWETLRDSGAFFEMLAASAAFLLIPQAAFSPVRALLPAPQSGHGAVYERECERRRTLAAARAFRALAASAKKRGEAVHNDENIAAVFDAAAERVCRKCRASADCWQKGYQDTLCVFNDLTPLLRTQGSVSAADFPNHFTARCMRLNELAAAVTEEMRAQTLRRRGSVRAAESCGAAAAQYADMADVLVTVADGLGGGSAFDPEMEKKLVCYLRSLDIEASAAVFRDRGGRLRAELAGPHLRLLLRDGDYLNKLSAVAGTRLCTTEAGAEAGRLELFEAEPLSVSVGIASRGRGGEAESGDRTACFKTDAGHLCLILSDGAGSGEAAGRCSENAVGMLRDLLCAGILPETALRLLNSLLLVESAGEADSAAVDLLDLDLFTGGAILWKAGSPPSYAVFGGRVKRLAAPSPAAPLGALPDAAPGVQHLKLPPGSRLALVSDGVACGLDDGWLLTALAETRGESVQEAADRVALTAAEKFGGDDDLTVLLAAVEERV